MSYELIVTEKPNAAKKLAESLADYKVIKKSHNGVPYYEITHKGKDIVVACAVGHLFTVEEVEKEKKWVYPVYDIKWVPNSDKKSAFSKKYLSTIKKLAKDATEFTVACDYDIEGEVIGLNVVRYACKQKDANRMKFSTLTKPDLVKSYEHKLKHLDWGQANAGETRHFLDWLYGINLSRALTLSVKSAGSFKLLSIGRVQGPALKIIVDKEKEIRAFKPEPYWQIELKGKVEGSDIISMHKEDKIFNEQRADEIVSKTTKKDGVVFDLTTKAFNQAPPTPFDLTTLQTEAHRCHSILPKDTLSTAQNLYLAGVISYPRTSSQKLPKELGYKEILKQLARQHEYKEHAEVLLSKKELKPNEGTKSDPAHPAIHPTGITPETLTSYEKKIYDLIVRRFLATFADPAKRQTVTATIDIQGEPFITKGTTTLEKGWHTFYGPYAKFKEEELPVMKKGDVVLNKKITKYDKETQPPKRYTASSIIQELEKRGLGTKATRAQIVENLYQRGYVDEKSITATEIGIRTCEILEKYSPEILDEALTRGFEEEMDEIREEKKTSVQVLDHAKKELNVLLDHFKGKEKIIGEDLLNAHKETRHEQNYIGKCSKCGGDLMIKKGKFGRFVGCSGYPECTVTLKLPQTGTVKSEKETCEVCHAPMISISRPKQRQVLCLNPECASKHPEGGPVEESDEKKTCPTCNEGHMILRKSVYGQFYGCSRYPKCKYTEKV